MARILSCNSCKTADILPDYATENDLESKHDYALKDAIEKHLARYGGGPDQHKSLLIRIDDEELALIDASRLEKAVHDGRLEEFLKQERESYKNDALSCYELRNRPTYGIGYGSGCSDYRSDAKAIGRTTGIPKEEWTYLCDFCPYHSYVMHAANKKRGIG